MGLFDNAGDTTVWPLTRVNADGTTETVPAELDLTPMLSVVKDETTSLVIRFKVAGVFPITFDLGSVAVSVEVDEGSSILDIELAAPALTVASIGTSDTTPAELPPRLPALGDTGDSYVATLHTVGRWVITRPQVVCIDVEVSSEATGNQGFIDLVAEVPSSGSDQLCIEQFGPQQAILFISFFRQGNATTPLLSDLGDRKFFIHHGISADIEADIFDGTTLHLDALLGVQPAFMNAFGNIAAEVDTPDGGTTIDGWFQVNEFDDDGTITVAPR